MKRDISICLFALFAVPVFGQHGGGGGSPGHGGDVSPGRGGFAPDGFGAGHARFRSGIGLRPMGFQHRFRPALLPYGYPLFDYGYDYSGYNEYPPEPNVIVVPQPAPQMVMQAPREPVQAAIHEYREAPTVLPAAPMAKGEEVQFVIALSDGSRRSANAVWVQDNVLHYIDPDDKQQQISMRSVDRHSTRRINRERNLDLWLPAAH